MENNGTPTPPPVPPTPTPTTPVPVASPTSTRAIFALILGILSLTCCGFFAGIPAIFLGRADMKLFDQGQLSESNKTLAKIGMILGIVGTALSLLGTIVYILIFALGITASLMQGSF